VRFVKSPQTRVPSEFALLPHTHRYHETALDTADSRIVERELGEFTARSGVLT